MSVTPLKTPKQTGDFELTPEGVYLARCYKMIDIGTQEETSQRYGTKYNRKIILYWELLGDVDGKEIRMADGRPFSISQKYTWSMHKKANLRKHLDSWRGKPFTEDEASEFEITKLLGQTCLLQVVHNETGDNTYANVGTIMTTNKEAEGVNELVSFSVDNPDMAVFESLSDWLQEKIRQAPEWKGAGEVADQVEGGGADPAEKSEPVESETGVENVKF